MSFPREGGHYVAESSKNDKCHDALTKPMRTATTQGIVQRLVTGNRCELQGCYEMAFWLVTFGSDTSHRCPKHTREYMRDFILQEVHTVPEPRD